MASLCHPNVVKMYGMVEEQGTRNIVLEYLALGDLKEFLKVRGRGHTEQGQTIGAFLSEQFVTTFKF